jgi:4-carboxymuconolactone decarboxylase
VAVTANEDLTLHALDAESLRLIQLAAALAGGDEPRVRQALSDAVDTVRVIWVEELLLQTYLFAGFPRALNGMREWRRVSGRAAPSRGEVADPAKWRRMGERTCARVYGVMYDRLRENIRVLHPELDEWMIVEGYGKVLSRPGLDLGRRELCIVAACAASDQMRQLHSHLHGALNVGVSPSAVESALEVLELELGIAQLAPVRLLWARVRGK